MHLLNDPSQRIDRHGTTDPVLLVPYAWIGDFVRCHTVVRLLKARWPDRPIDVLAPTLCAQLLDYMPGVRKGIVWDLPRRRLPFGQHLALARRLRMEHYRTALIMPRTWKAALAPFLAGIPERIGFVGETRFGLINDLRWGERRLDRMIDRCAVLALPKGAPWTEDWPPPQIVVPDDQVAAWQARAGLTGETHPVAALAPGAVGRGKRWPVGHYGALARSLVAHNVNVWVLGGPNETPLAREIAAIAGPRVRDLTGGELRNAVMALKAADLTVANDSGLMHVSAAIGTPTIGLFGPTGLRVSVPLNPLAETIEPPPSDICPTCGKSGCAIVSHRRTEDIAPDRVLESVMNVLAARGATR